MSECSGRTGSDWVWDPTLFAGAAAWYERGRLPYAPGLADAMADMLGLDGTSRLLDVGCGPGKVTLLLAHLFAEAVGLDPDPGMLTEARRLAAERGVGNATWVQARAEELPAGLGHFRAVTFAASFHWMDRLRVARAVRGMLTPGGAAVQVDAPGYRADARAADATLAHPLPPEEGMAELVRRWLGPERRAGQGVRTSSPDGEDAVFRAAGFPGAQTVVVPDGRVVERTIDDQVASVFSGSPTAPHLFGEHLGEFEAELRALLAASTPTGRFAIRLPDNVLSIWRVP